MDTTPQAPPCAVWPSLWTVLLPSEMPCVMGAESKGLSIFTHATAASLDTLTEQLNGYALYLASYAETYKTSPRHSIAAVSFL